jgi:putative transposase
MAEYRHTAHATFDLKYHVIWITKYRYEILRGRVAERARDLIRQVCQAREAVIIRGAVSPDHIHMLLWLRRIWHRRRWCNTSKGGHHGSRKKNFRSYWGQHLWARGYFCATVGAVDEQMIKSYIENQKWDEDDQGFKITAPAEP